MQRDEAEVTQSQVWFRQRSNPTQPNPTNSIWECLINYTNLPLKEKTEHLQARVSSLPRNATIKLKL